MTFKLCECGMGFVTDLKGVMIDETMIPLHENVPVLNRYYIEVFCTTKKLWIWPFRAIVSVVSGKQGIIEVT